MIAAISSITIFGGAFVLLAADRIHRVKVVLFAAGLMLATGLVPADKAFYSHTSGIDWDVIFLLLGMMVIVSVIQRTGCSTTWRSPRRNDPAAAPMR